jgi:hypothetical protein
MKGWGRQVGLLACAAMALLLAPAAAVAKPGYVVFPGSHTVELNLKGSHGYRIQISEVNHRWTELYASNYAGLAVYLIPGSTGDSEIEAEFPGVGRVSMRFHPLGGPHREKEFFPSCDGGTTIEQPGYFLGKVRLRGERGYTSVRATRARGRIVRTEKETCRRSVFDDQSEPNEDITQLVAYSRSAGRTIGFYGSFVEIAPETFTSFSGSVNEHRDGMTIARHTVISGEASDFAIGDAGPFPLSATLTPPGPFHGSGVFQRMPGGDNAWTGSLSVSLPGAGRVALAGPRFSARLCQRSGCRQDKGQRLSAFIGRRAARRAFAR